MPSASRPSPSLPHSPSLVWDFWPSCTSASPFSNGVHASACHLPALKWVYSRKSSAICRLVISPASASIRAVSSIAEFIGYVELAPGFAPRAQITHVLFDFDGTLSLIREGWPEVMLGMFVEMLPTRP